MDSDDGNIRIVSDGEEYRKIIDSFHDNFESLRGLFYKPGMPRVNILLKDNEFVMKKRRDDSKIITSLLGEIFGELDSYDIFNLLIKSKHDNECYGIVKDIIECDEDIFELKDIIGIIPFSEKGMEYCSNIGKIYATDDRPKFNLVLGPNKNYSIDWWMKVYPQFTNPNTNISDLFSGLFNP